MLSNIYQKGLGYLEKAASVGSSAIGMAKGPASFAGNSLLGVGQGLFGSKWSAAALLGGGFAYGVGSSTFNAAKSMNIDPGGDTSPLVRSAASASNVLASSAVGGLAGMGLGGMKFGGKGRLAGAIGGLALGAATGGLLNAYGEGIGKVGIGMGAGVAVAGGSYNLVKGISNYRSGGSYKGNIKGGLGSLAMGAAVTYAGNQVRQINANRAIFDTVLDMRGRNEAYNMSGVDMANSRSARVNGPMLFGGNSGARGSSYNLGVSGDLGLALHKLRRG